MAIVNFVWAVLARLIKEPSGGEFRVAGHTVFDNEFRTSRREMAWYGVVRLMTPGIVRVLCIGMAGIPNGGYDG